MKTPLRLQAALAFSLTGEQAIQQSEMETDPARAEAKAWTGKILSAIGDKIFPDSIDEFKRLVDEQ